MTEVLAFMAGNACLTSFLACVALLCLSVAGQVLLHVSARLIRAANIRAHGWPPEHLDADGDHVRLIKAVTETRADDSDDGSET